MTEIHPGPRTSVRVSSGGLSGNAQTVEFDVRVRRGARHIDLLAKRCVICGSDEAKETITYRAGRWGKEPSAEGGTIHYSLSACRGCGKRFQEQYKKYKRMHSSLRVFSWVGVCAAMALPAFIPGYSGLIVLLAVVGFVISLTSIPARIAAKSYSRRSLPAVHVERQAGVIRLKTGVATLGVLRDEGHPLLLEAAKD